MVAHYCLTTEKWISTTFILGTDRIPWIKLGCNYYSKLVDIVCIALYDVVGGGLGFVLAGTC